ncbi:MAG: hypothetical protein IPK16_29250 [Anaerolineales bacterium]|nr:hypothetical protein [Anaerolineales bacterium]
MRPTPPIAAGAQVMAVEVSAQSKPSRKELVPLVVMTVLVIVSGLMVWEPLAAILDQSVTILSGV